MSYIEKTVTIGILLSVIIPVALYVITKAVFKLLESRDICRHCKNAKMCIKVKYLYPDSYLFEYAPNRFHCTAYNKIENEIEDNKEALAEFRREIFFSFQKGKR